jgi:hypothetical protein
MIIAKVTYRVKSEFVEKNQENINLFMKDFEKLDNKLFRYTAYLSTDGKTFVHLSHYQNEEIQKQLLSVESFKSFQLQRDASGLEALPQIEMMNVVAGSRDIFN